MQQMSLREYIDNLERDGYTVRDDHGDDPVLIRPDGQAPSRPGARTTRTTS